MDNKKLKEKIKTNTLDDAPIILVYEDNTFICHQYINQIVKNKRLEKLNINKISDITGDDKLFDNAPSTIYVYEVDKLDEYVDPELKNLIIICKQIINTNKDINVVKIDKLTNWQIEDYVKTRAPGLSEPQARWLCEISKYNIYRLQKECDKLSIFSGELQKLLFNEMNEENMFCDLNNLTIFNFITAVVNRDYTTITEVLENIRWIDIEPIGVCNALLKQFKVIIEAKFYNQWSETMLCSEKQFKYLKYNLAHKYGAESLVTAYEKLTSIDYLLKSGYLPENTIIDYILINILTIQ